MAPITDLSGVCEYFDDSERTSTEAMGEKTNSKRFIKVAGRKELHCQELLVYVVPAIAILLLSVANLVLCQD